MKSFFRVSLPSVLVLGIIAVVFLGGICSKVFAASIQHGHEHHITETNYQAPSNCNCGKRLAETPITQPQPNISLVDTPHEPEPSSVIINYFADLPLVPNPAQLTFADRPPGDESIRQWPVILARANL